MQLLAHERAIKARIANSLSGPVSSDLLDEMTFAYIDLQALGSSTPDIAAIVQVFTDGKVTVDTAKILTQEVHSAAAHQVSPARENCTTDTYATSA